MNAAKCIFVSLTLLILAGCVANGDGQGLHFGQPETYNQDRGPSLIMQPD